MEQKAYAALTASAALVPFPDRYRALIGMEPIAPEAWETHKRAQLAKYGGTLLGRMLWQMHIRDQDTYAVLLRLLTYGVAVLAAVMITSALMPFTIAGVTPALVTLTTGLFLVWAVSAIIRYCGFVRWPAQWREVALDRAIPPPYDVYELIARIAQLMPDVRFTVHELWQEEIVDPALEVHDDATGESLIAAIWDAPVRMAHWGAPQP